MIWGYPNLWKFQIKDHESMIPIFLQSATQGVWSPVSCLREWPKQSRHSAFCLRLLGQPLPGPTFCWWMDVHPARYAMFVSFCRVNHHWIPTSSSSTWKRRSNFEDNQMLQPPAVAIWLIWPLKKKIKICVGNSCTSMPASTFDSLLTPIARGCNDKCPPKQCNGL